MPICPKCGKYHKRSHHKRYVRSCGGWRNPALEHMIVSRSVGARDYKAMQDQIKKERLKIGMKE